MLTAKQVYEYCAKAHDEATLAAKLDAHSEAEHMNAMLTHVAKARSWRN